MNENYSFGIFFIDESNFQFSFFIVTFAMLGDHFYFAYGFYVDIS